MMSGQKAGVALTVVADALRLVVIAILATPPEHSANIRAGTLGLLTLPLSIVAAVVLITTTASTAPRAASAASIALWTLFVVPRGPLQQGTACRSSGLSAILALSASAALIGTAHRRQRR
ncbi:hypothetical protein SAMN06893096_1108 [Geodermatophilus pulveris]|uniref:Uncharacterized protein n=1 Tax=Geodermatophilus pulveris TaxID=1564159 RepID=A0A239I5Y6_9ACTN|nr:hypothetical protein [Geodermatophilus pulveris]SNS89025.1 hypothetical protein SAMN06893096_1108 [Geodermatophilus pulveris]